MNTEYKQLGQYIRVVDVRNKEMVTDNLLGINIDKYFMPSVANTIGTDLSKYKLISKNLFACNPMHVGRDKRLPVALYNEDNPALVSPAYFMFKVIDSTVLMPEYLMMWFRRPEFDRKCCFYTDSSVRGGITWDDICRLELLVPDIEKQKEIVKTYRTITDRIALKKKINDNLVAELQALFLKTFGIYTDNIDIIIQRNQIPTTLNDICSFISKGITPTYTDDKDEMIINQKCINNNRINYDFVKYHISKNVSEKYLQKGDILINSTGTGTLGRSAQYWGDCRNITVDSHITIVRTKDELHLYYVGILCQILQSVFENMQTGSTAQTDLPRERLKTMILGIPNEDLLLFFNKIAEKSIKFITIIEKEIKILEETKKLLLSTRLGK